MSIEAISGKVFLIVTGASRGIGRQIAISFASHLQEGSYMLLLARDVKNLKDVAIELQKNVTVCCESTDLSITSADELKSIILKSIQNNLDQFERVVVIHNVGSMGDLDQSSVDLIDFDSWQKYYNLNVFSPAILNGVVMKLFANKENIKKVVINISSLLGIKPTKYATYYCSGKAAREMIFKVFALENPNVNVLNYSPGPVETDMFDTVCKNLADQETRDSFVNLRETKKVLTTEQTVKRLLEVLKQHKYESGDHVDYFDEL